jgi:uncharacterized protein
MKKVWMRILMVVFLTISLLGLPIVSGKIASMFNYIKIDPNGVFMWISVHHIVQALFFIIFIVMIQLVIRLLNQKNKESVAKIDFGFGLGHKKLGIKYVSIFTAAFLVYTAIGFAIALITKTFNPPWYPINSRNVFGYLGFQLLLSGPSEEILFRSFGITMLALVWNKRIFKGKLSIANLVLGIIFGLAHIGIYFSPFELRYSLFQVIYAFALGLIYGDCFEKTGSVYYSMALHSISNVIAVGATIIVALLI